MCEMRDVPIKRARFFPKPTNTFTMITNPLDPDGLYARAWTSGGGLLVMASVAVYEDGLEWVHISVSRKNKLPSYSDMVIVKQNFVGLDRKAVMIFPEQKNHVNIHKNCLHLFYSEDNPLPEFSGMLGGVRSI